MAKAGRFEGSSAPKSQTLIVLSFDPDTILVPSGENATDEMKWLWAFVFSTTHLMSVANILRTREKFREAASVHSAAWRLGTTSGCKLEGRLMYLGADEQQPTACRKDECGVWLRSSSRTKSHMPLREAVQLGVSGLGSQVVVMRTRVEMVEAALPGCLHESQCVSQVKSNQNFQVKSSIQVKSS